MTEQSLISSMASDMESTLDKDVISHNLVGASSSTSIALCNSRCWHGLLSVYDPQHGRNKVLLSTLDDSVSAGGNTYYLSVRKYPGGVFFPMGYQYISSVSYSPIVAIEYSLGDDTVLRKEILLAGGEATLLVRYSLLAAKNSVRVSIRPIVAFRLADELRRRNLMIFTDSVPVSNGIAYQPNADEPQLYLQTSAVCNFAAAPDWNYNIEYSIDHKEGRPYQEDLFMPGFFDVVLAPGQDFVFSASLKEQRVERLSKMFDEEFKKIPSLFTYEDRLKYAASRMFRVGDVGVYVVEKFPPTGYYSKDVCGALAGLTLPDGDFKTFRAVVDTYIDVYRSSLAIGSHIKDYAPEAPLWFVWAIQQYTYQHNDHYKVFCEYGESVKRVINDIMRSRMSGLFMDNSGLLALIYDDRQLYYVEINAMWYNALMFYAELCCVARCYEDANNCSKLARIMKKSFWERFKIEELGYFADSYDSIGNVDRAFRIGQILAYALPYAAADADQMAAVLPMMEEKLLTPVGMRTMAASDPRYAKEGKISPFYFGFFAELCIRVRGSEGVENVKEIYNTFKDGCNGVVPPCFYEQYSPEPPFEGKGAPLSAVAIATLNRMRLLIRQF